MPHDDTLSSQFREALRPLIRSLAAGRTLSLSKTGMLGRLDDHGPATAAELAAIEQVTPQAVAVSLRELEEEGLVTRDTDPEDRRRRVVRVTDAGRDRLREERSRGTQWLDGAIHERLDDSDRATLAAVVPVLRKLSGQDIDE